MPRIIPKNRSLKPSGKRLAKGEESRRAILLAAAKLSTTQGLNGLSIGDLATHLGMSKSGLYAHFKSKEELELATIEAAAEIYRKEVIESALDAKKGLTRLMALVDGFLSHLKRRVFPGGCFFAALAAELDTRPGPARDRVAQMQGDWLNLLKECLVDAQSAGELGANIDVAQTTFEVDAMLVAANAFFVLMNDAAPLAKARKGVENILAGMGAKRLPHTGQPL